MRGNFNSQVIKYAIVALVSLVFALFWLVGYDRPFEEDPNFNAPLFTDLLLVTSMLLLLCAIAVAVWSAVWSLGVSGRGEAVSNNIPVRKIGMVVGVATFAVMLFTFLFGSRVPMTINGSVYDNSVWLRVSDMFVATSLIMIAAGVAAVLYGSTKHIRRP